MHTIKQVYCEEMRGPMEEPTSGSTPGQGKENDGESTAEHGGEDPPFEGDVPQVQAPRQMTQWAEGVVLLDMDAIMAQFD